MPKSQAFIRIKAEVISAIRGIPEGRVSTFADIGEFLEVMARHVAYISATLSPDERAETPWHRVVTAEGVVPGTNAGRRREQVRLLETEAVVVDRSYRVVGFDALRMQWPKANSTVGAAAYGPYSDPATPLRFAESEGRAAALAAKPSARGRKRKSSAR